jgi:hypothetical protein
LRKKLKISTRDLRYVAIVAIFTTILTSTIVYVTLNPQPTEGFFAMDILGQNGLAEHYFPADDPNVTIGASINWSIGVYNHMGSLEYVVVSVKLLNSSLPGPDETMGTPSPIPQLLDFRKVLADNETWNIPFTWIIDNATQKGNSISITGISINQTEFNGNFVTAVSGYNYRFVFELWFYDQDTQNLTFSWNSMGIQRSVWTQLWFNVTTTSSK